MNKETKSELKKYKNWLNKNHVGMYSRISDYSLNKYIKEQLTIPVVGVSDIQVEHFKLRELLDELNNTAENWAKKHLQ